MKRNIFRGSRVDARRAGITAMTLTMRNSLNLPAESCKTVVSIFVPVPSIEERGQHRRSDPTLVPDLYIVQNFRVKSGRNSDQAELLFQPAVSLIGGVAQVVRATVS
jgi:hypothetical protein